MKLIFTLILNLITALNTIEIAANDFKISANNKLLADIYLIKDSVDNLLNSKEVTKKSQINQQEILQKLQTEFFNNLDLEKKDIICNKITGMFNTTVRKYNDFENAIITKLKDIQTKHTEHLNIKQSNHDINCDIDDEFSTGVPILAYILKGMNEKLNIYERELQTLDKKLYLQQNIFDKLMEMQSKILQDISDKFNRNEDQFIKINQELTKLKELERKKVNQKPKFRLKLPMEVIMDLSSSNINKITTETFEKGT